MTEAEWLECGDPDETLFQLANRVNDRKLRCFVSACCRRIWYLFTNKVARKAVEALEQYADGLTTREELERCHKAVNALYEGALKGRYKFRTSLNVFAVATFASIGEFDFKDVLEVAAQTRYAVMDGGDVEVERAAQAALLRDICANPYRSLPKLEGRWLIWTSGTIGKLACAIYDERAFDQLPILADALEEAGCTNADILNHCRQPGEHVRGCWVIDLLLGKS